MRRQDACAAKPPPLTLMPVDGSAAAALGTQLVQLDRGHDRFGRVLDRIISGHVELADTAEARAAASRPTPSRSDGAPSAEHDRFEAQRCAMSGLQLGEAGRRASRRGRALPR